MTGPILSTASLVKGICLISASAAVLQAVPSGQIEFLPSFHELETLTLNGALIIAVIVLWKRLGAKDDQIAKKDDQLAEAAKSTTTALLSGAETMKELRKAVESVTEANRELREAVRQMATGVSPHRVR